MNSLSLVTRNKRLIRILCAATFLLAIPMFAMIFTAEVNWKASDFIIMGILLFGTGLLCELVLRKVKKTGQRVLLCGAVMLVFFLIWAELAVGIFGTPFAGS